MAFHESSNPPFAKKGSSPTDRQRGFHLRINWDLLGVKIKKVSYVSNYSCSSTLERCRELSSHSPALQGETTSWLQPLSNENLGHLGGITCIEVEPHTKEQCAWVIRGGKELLVGALMLWVFGREMRAINWLSLHKK